MGRIFRVWCSVLFLVILLSTKAASYEKTLRKIVRNQSKMVHRPFSDNDEPSVWRNSSAHGFRFNKELLFPGAGVLQRMETYHNLYRPRIATTMPSIESMRSSAGLFKSKIIKPDPPDDRLMQVKVASTAQKLEDVPLIQNSRNVYLDGHNFTVKNFYQIPAPSRFFPPAEESYRQKDNVTLNTIVVPDPQEARVIDRAEQIASISKSQIAIQPDSHEVQSRQNVIENNVRTDIFEVDKIGDYQVERVNALLPADNSEWSVNLTAYPHTCEIIKTSKTDIDTQDRFCQLNIEPSWVIKKQYWNKIFDSRYESLMRNPKWPPLKVILIPRTHVDSIWKKTYMQYHKDSAIRILSNMIKKLQFYDHLTFSWHEVSHLSSWWQSTTNKNRSAFRKLLKGGRLEITTGGWVETDEATTHLFGLVHQLIEGHQWLKLHLNYHPKVAWLTNSVSHSPTVTYLLSTLNIHQLVITNLHYSWEQHLAEYQYSDFVWTQHWDQDKTYPSKLNDDLTKIGNDRHPKHSVLTHFLQFNADDFSACGPDSALCNSEYNFAIHNQIQNLDITAYNIKDKAEKLLEQYSKAGTLSLHNTIIAPIGGSHHFEAQTEFDYQYNNYLKIADFINANKDIYKATMEFGTAQDYFTNIVGRYKNYPSLKGDFPIFADIKSGTPAYWTGYYTSRPFAKILLRRLQSTLRTTEILFSYALSSNVFRRFNLSEIYEVLLKSRENVARLMDRNVVSGTMSANALKYVYDLILRTVKDCWYIQELSASFLTLKPESSSPYLQKYVYKDGEFISRFRSISPGDQLFLFNSLSHERTEIVEVITRYLNIRILDHNNKDVTIQINPIWKHNVNNFIKLSRKFYKIIFVAVIPSMTLTLYKINETYDASHNAATLYCLACTIEEAKSDKTIFPFRMHPIQSGDIQLESYKHRLIFDEMTGFLKTIVEKETNIEKTVFIEYGAFRDSNFNSGMFLFNTNVSNPLHDILTSYRVGNKSKNLLIVSGLVTTELITIYGRLLHHTTRVFNILNNPLSKAIYIESKVDYDISPHNRELEMFLSIQTGITNGNPPQIYTDNNSYQYTQRTLNLNRRVESNMNPVTSMAFIQDQQRRLTFITDHAHGVTALQEGQLVVMLDRRVLFDDGRGTDEGLADSSATCHRHYILLENLDYSNKFSEPVSQDSLVLPSLNALYLANTLSYLLDAFIVENKQSNLGFYQHLSLINQGFPCDVSVLNYRVILNRNTMHHSYPTAALMILHRQSFSCKVIGAANVQCHSDSYFTLDKILRKVKTIHQTNLAGTNAGEMRHTFDLTSFPPMELITLRLEF